LQSGFGKTAAGAEPALGQARKRTNIPDAPPDAKAAPTFHEIR
jgi:hypothetical protein